jgi:undecaprenyl pyrophosphate phosphatase UppP
MICVNKRQYKSILKSRKSNFKFTWYCFLFFLPFCFLGVFSKQFIWVSVFAFMITLLHFCVLILLGLELKNLHNRENINFIKEKI